MESVLNAHLSAIAPDQIRNVFKPFYTLKASLLSFALTTGDITDQQYLDSTFSIMVTICNFTFPHDYGSKPVVMSIYESAYDMGAEIRRAFSAHNRGVPVDVRVWMRQGHTFLLHDMPLGDITPTLRLLKARGGFDEMYVSFGPDSNAQSLGGLGD